MDTGVARRSTRRSARCWRSRRRRAFARSSSTARRGTHRLERRLRRWFPPHDDSRAARRRSSSPRARGCRVTSTATARTAASCRSKCTAPPFEQRVWRALPRSRRQTRSYGAIARQLGAFGASRAVGLANGANPIAIIVPCHRVIGSNGSLDRLRRRPRPQNVAAQSRKAMARDRLF